MALKKICSLIICFITMFSCVENLDFSQIEDYSASQSLTFSVAHFNVTSTNFAPPVGAPATTEVTQKSDFRIFENNVIRNNLTQVDFQFEINNDFNRDFTIEISLLDLNDNIIYALNDLKIAANKINIPPIETILVSSNPNIKNISKVSITIKLDDITTPIQSTDIGEVGFKSAATIYIETLN